jgi:hypothetical protein
VSFIPIGGNFQCPVEIPIELHGRWNKEMKLITRSQLRRVTGKVCSMGLYEEYVLAARADTALMRIRYARFLYSRAKLRNRQLRKQYLHNQKEVVKLTVEPKRGICLLPGRLS